MGKNEKRRSVVHFVNQFKFKRTLNPISKLLNLIGKYRGLTLPLIYFFVGVCGVSQEGPDWGGGRGGGVINVISRSRFGLNKNLILEHLFVE